MKIKRLKSIYNGMITRCYNKSSINYKYYGGKNVKVCDEWKNDFNSFYEWSLKNGYSDELTLDRVDNLNGYQPNNCKWSTIEDTLTKKTSDREVKITYDDKTMTMREWADFLQIPKTTLSSRRARGWSDKEIIEGKRSTFD